MKALTSIFGLYVILMGLLSMLVTAPIMWRAMPNAYFGVLAVFAVWVTIIAIVLAVVVELHESSKPREKHDS
nr:MAG TPA: hypothetical protein [Caudoviricetes sp.]